jgi:hypothetical protein
MNSFRHSTFAFHLALLLGLATAAVAQQKGGPTASVAAKMRESVERFVAALPE